MRFACEISKINLCQQLLTKCLYQVSKMVVHEIQFGGIAAESINSICHIVTNIRY